VQEKITYESVALLVAREPTIGRLWVRGLLK